MFVLSVRHWDGEETPIQLEVLGLREDFDTAVKDARESVEDKQKTLPPDYPKTTIFVATDDRQHASVQLKDDTGIILVILVEAFVPEGDLRTYSAS